MLLKKKIEQVRADYLQKVQEVAAKRGFEAAERYKQKIAINDEELE